jgi:hypothetical protein
MVKCLHCAWTGSIADDEQHQNKCQKARPQKHKRSDSDNCLIETLRSKKAALERQEEEVSENLKSMMYQLSVRDAIIENLECRNRTVQTENDSLVAKVSQLESQNSKLKVAAVKMEQLEKLISSQNQREKLLKKTTGGYDYDRFKVVKLTKLICQDLESMPEDINGAKIFDCVKAIYKDFETGYQDNPEHFYIDVRMLLCVCSASVWFTSKQTEHFRRWLTEQHWS